MKSPSLSSLGWFLRPALPVAVVLSPLVLAGLAFAAGQAEASKTLMSAESAARGQGIVRGQVSNLATGEFLEGAIVKVEGTSTSTTTERGGAFMLSLPSGNHTLAVNYTGLTTLRIPVVVAAGRVMTENVALTSDIYRLDPFTVSGMREGSALAIQLQRQADNVKTIVAADQFGTPANNPGELLQRLAGVNVDLQGGEAVGYSIRGLDSSYSNLMVDGDSMASSFGTSPASRGVNIQQVGTNNIQSVELIKAPTPDMDANAISGYINLVTKRSFDTTPGRKIGLTVGTRWTQLPGGDVAKDKPGFDNITFSYSDVYSVLGGRNNLGVLLSASQRISPSVTDESGPASSFVASNAVYFLPSPTNALTTPLMRAFGVGSIYWPGQKSQTLGLNIDYKFSDRTYFYLKSSYNGVHIGENAAGAGYNRMFITTPAAQANFAPRSTYQLQDVLPTGSIATLVTGHQKRQTNTPALSTGFESKFPQIAGKLNFNASYSLADSRYPIISVTRMDTRLTPGIGWRIDRRGIDDSYQPGFTQTSGPALTDPANYAGSTSFLQRYTAPNRKTGARLDFKKDFHFAVPAYVKIGAKWSSDLKEQTNRVVYKTYVGPQGIDRKYIAPLTRQGAGKYGPFPYLAAPYSGRPADIMQNTAQWAQRGQDSYLSSLYSDQGRALDGSTEEKVGAAYAIGNVRLGKLRLLSGLRVEETDQIAIGYARNQTASWGGNYDATKSDADNAARALRAVLPLKTYTRSYRNVFPGLHLTYEPADRLLVRFSYNSTITRPPTATILPTIVVNPDTRVLTSPNPNLKPYTSDNFELAVQKYFEPVGSFEVGVFLKEIKNYFRSVISTVEAGSDNGFNGEYEGYTWTRTFNVGGARYRGIEFSYTQQYKFLPGALRGLGSFANFTYLQAQGDFGSTTFQKKIANQRPRTANAGISYSGYGFQGQLLANWVDSYYRSGVGALSIYAEPQFLLDLKTSFRINRTVQVYFDVFNLLDENVTTFRQEGGMKIYAQKQGIIFSTGVNLHF